MYGQANLICPPLDGRYPADKYTPYSGVTMATVSIGKKVPSFTLPATGDCDISLSDFKGKKLVLYFYPKDNTPGCTKESEGFRDNIRKFTNCGTQVIGVSRDSIKSHENFKTKKELPFPLISDEDEVLCDIFAVVKSKSMYGRTFLGIERSTFLIDEKSVLRKEWRKVKVTGHVDEVLEAAKSL